MPAHDDADIDAGQRAEIEIDAEEGAGDELAAEMKPGVWSFSTRSLSMVFGACTKAIEPPAASVRICWVPAVSLPPI